MERWRQTILGIRKLDVDDTRALLDKKEKCRERKTQRMKFVISQDADEGSASLCYLLLMVEDTRQPWFQDNTPVTLTANGRNAASSTSGSSDESLLRKSTIHAMNKVEQQNDCCLAAVN